MILMSKLTAPLTSHQVRFFSANEWEYEYSLLKYSQIQSYENQYEYKSATVSFIVGR